jgi:hypothetical protein
MINYYLLPEEQEGVLFWKACLLFGVDPPPFQCSTQTKRVLICSFLNSASICVLIKTKTDLLESYGAKTEIRMPVYTWPTRHPQLQLACTAPHCFSKFHWLSLACTNLEVWSEYCSIGLTHPTACTVCSDFWTLQCTNPPFYPICSKRMAIDWACAEDSDRWYISNSGIIF